MMGFPENPVLAGIIPRSFEHIFKIIEGSDNKKFLVRCTYVEIYNE
jgi:kinesin family protein 3/17